MNNRDHTLLTMFEDFFRETGFDPELTDIDGREALEVTFTPSQEDAPMECTVTVTHPEESTTAVQILFSLFEDLPLSLTLDCIPFLCRFNTEIGSGSFGAMEETGFVYFSSAFVADYLSDKNVLLSLSAEMDVLLLLAFRGRGLLLPLVEGTVTKEELQRQDPVLLQD